MACEEEEETTADAGSTPKIPFPVPWPGGCGGSSALAASVRPASGLAISVLATAFGISAASVREGIVLVTGGTGWAGPAEASLTCPAFICTVFTLTGFMGSDEPGIAAIGWVWMTPLVSGAGSLLASVLAGASALG